MKLNKLSNNLGAKKDKIRVGRGIGSGKGKTCGRGVKGQKSRSGVAIKGFEGGQTSIIKRVPKRGFKCPTSKKYKIINIIDIEFLVEAALLNPAEVITKEKLVQVGLIKNMNVLVKLLAGHNKLNIGLLIKLDSYSTAVKEIVEEAGGQIVKEICK